MTQTLLYALVVLNIATFFIYGLDKWKAKQNAWRIPEKTLLGLALLGGSIGAWIGMRTWRHKTQHPQFKYGIPVILAIQIFLVGYFMSETSHSEREWLVL